MAAHGGDAGLLGDLHQRLGIIHAVGDRDFHQHMLAGAHHLLALAEMHLGRRGEDHRVGALDAFGQFAGVMRDAVFLGDLGGGILIAADQRGDFDIGDALERVEMLLPERALPRYANFHRFPLLLVVMPGLVPGIHVLATERQKTWMAGSSPAMTLMD